MDITAVPRISVREFGHPRTVCHQIFLRTRRRDTSTIADDCVSSHHSETRQNNPNSFMIAIPTMTKLSRGVAGLLALLAAGASDVEAQVFLIDFGAAGNTTEHAAAPDDPVNYWNNISESVGTSSTGQLANLVTSDNTPSTISLVMLSRFNGANTAGTTESTLFPMEATRDSLFGNTELFGTLSNVFPSFKLAGLDASTVYNFAFYASRTGVNDNRETGYTVEGGNSGFAALNPVNNLDNLVTVDGITPDGTGAITISLAPTANNDNANHFTYLGVLKVTAIPPQTPIVFTQEPANQRVAEFQTATFTSAVQGSAPYFIQWFSNDVAIPGANQFTYTIPVATFDMNGAQFSVNVSNLAFSATSSNAMMIQSARLRKLFTVTSFSGVIARGRGTVRHSNTDRNSHRPLPVRKPLRDVLFSS